MEKQELRKLLKEKRAAIPAEQRKEYDRAIVQNIACSDFFQNASMVLLYVPIDSEVNILPLARIARRLGKPIAFPRCNTEQNTMEFFILTEDMRLSPDAYRIPAPPANAPLCIPDERAVCIVPGLSFDPTGNRLGYGKGYYDRYLSTFPGVTVGALYAKLMLRHIPADPHDMAVEHLVTERGTFASLPDRLPPMREKKKETVDTPAQSKPSHAEKIQEKAQKTLAAVQQKLRLSSATAKEGIEGAKPLHTPPILVTVTFLLLILSRLLQVQLLDRDSEYIGAVLLQILIFILPAILYCKIKGDRFGERIRMHPPRPEHILFLLCALVLMITGGLLTSILTGGIDSLSGNFTLYSTFVAHTNGTAEIIYAILAYALLPAFGEELVFRSILCAEYEKYGAAVAISVSALFFAMLHFSFAHFLTYLVLGALLAACMYTTRSFFAPFVLHLCYNVFCLFGQPYLSAFYVNAGSNEIFLFSVTVLFLLFAAFAAGEARKIYHVYAKKNLDSSYTVSLPLRALPKTLFTALLTPAAAAVLVLWLVMATVNLF